MGAVLARVVLGPRSHHGGQGPTVTTSTVMRRRLPVDVVARGESGMALVVDERNHMGWVRLTPWFATEPWRSVAVGPQPGQRREPRPGDGLDPTPGGPGFPLGAPGASRDVGLGGL